MSHLSQLERLRDSFGPDGAERKLALLRALERHRFARARDVLRLHETLCFLHAYPDDGRVLEQVRRMLDRFGQRPDLKAHRDRLVDSGLAGTEIHYSFYWPTACWLEERWPERLSIDWDAFDNKEKLIDLLPLLAPYSATAAFEVLSHSPREWVERLKSPDETDAAFLIRSFRTLPGSDYTRESAYEALDVPIRISPAPGTPSRSGSRLETTRVQFRSVPLDRSRPDLRQAVRRPPLSVRAVSPRRGAHLIDLAREAMVTRSRDLDAFAYADRNDVRLIDCGDGLQFACFGVKPERRLMFEAVYGFLTLKNGVPLGYVLSGSLLGSSEIAYNVFDTYRSAEAARVFGRVLAMVSHLFGSDSFSIDPYQLGHGNAEGRESGAWWFYYKLGFRPEDPEVRRVLRGELKKMKADPRHRSGPATIERLSAEHLFFDVDRRRDATLGRVYLGGAGMQAARLLAERFGADRQAAEIACSREAARLLDQRSFAGWSRGERLAWSRWSPVVLALPGVSRWTSAQRRELALVVRTKGGRRESDFVERFNRHRRLRDAVLKLAP